MGLGSGGGCAGLGPQVATPFPKWHAPSSLLTLSRGAAWSSGCPHITFLAHTLPISTEIQ